MCGICGILRNGDRPVVIQELRAMTDAMMHRGPDDEGFLIDASAGLGFRRLAIVDVQNGHQPIANEDRTVWVVCNGEIYNYQSLRRDLVSRGHQLHTNTDTEVIAHLYEEHGIGCVEHLQGMFAIAILDLRSRELYLIRDRFGIKPLYYTESMGTLRFASEIRALLAGDGADVQMNEQTMWDYFTLQYIPSRDSIIEGVQKVPPAHYVRYRHGRIDTRQYFTPEYRPQNKPLQYFIEGVRHHLKESVDRHLQGEVPIGAFLSSGVDSSTLAALAQLDRQIRTFSVGFDDAKSHLDELGVAEQTAKRLGTIHESITLTKKDVLEHLPQILDSLEEPLGDPSALALYFLSEHASRHVKVVLSGEGADECFGGYPIYHEPLSLSLFRHIPEWSNRMLNEAAHRLPFGLKGRSFLLRGTTPIERRFVGNIQVFHEDAKHNLFESQTLRGELMSTFRLTDPIYERTASLDDITRMQIVDLCTWLPGDILLKADKMSMAHSLELRVPFLDMNLFDFASTIPVKYRVRDVNGKYVLREAVRQWLPDEVVERPKLGFPVPYRQWLKGEMSGLVWDVFQSSKLRSYFRASYVENMLVQHRNGTRDYGRELWTLFAFLMWYDTFQQKRKTIAS